MRTVSSLLLLILFQQSIYSQTNEWSPVSYNCYYGKDIYFFLSDVQMVNANTGYCLGYNGTVLKTSDGGKTWTEKLNFGNSGNFRAVQDLYMVNQDTGWIVGNTGTIYKTTDGFTSLTNQLNWPAPQVTERNLFGVHFINKDKGFACGFGGDILRTDNGGTNWRLLTVQENPAYDASFLSEIVFTSPDTGYAAGSLIEKTTDGGASWQIIYNKLNSNSILQDIFFLNSHLGWAVGSNDTLLATTNGGQTWVPQQLPVKNLDLRSVEFVSPTEGIIWASLKSDGSSKVFRTQNGGLNWVEESMTPEINKYFLSGASFRSGNQWVSIGVGYLGMMFRNCKLPKPIISKVKSDLVSSYASGNQWYKNNVLIPGATSKTFNPTKTGSGSYTVKSSVNDCSSFISNPYIIGTVKNESNAQLTIRDMDVQDVITIYPNPTQDQLYVNGIQALSTVEIVNMTGSKVLQRNIQGTSASIDVSRLHPGVYFVVIRQGNNLPVIQKMIKEQ